MSEYRKKALVEARQLTRENWPELLAWIEGGKQYIDADGAVDGLTIFTLEGRMKADFGDWIVKGIKGEFWPVKPDVFAATYQPEVPVPDHECSFLFQPLDDDGKPQDRDHCRHCGKTRAEAGAELETAATVARLTERLQRAEESRDEESRRTLRWAGIFCEIRDACNEAAATGGGIDPGAVLEIMKHHQADDPATVTRTEWGAAYEGEEQPGVLFGVREYDDREGAEEMIRNAFADVLVTRTVTATPWQRVPAEVPSEH